MCSLNILQDHVVLQQICRGGGIHTVNYDSRERKRQNLLRNLNQDLLFAMITLQQNAKILHSVISFLQLVSQIFTHWMASYVKCISMRVHVLTFLYRIKSDISEKVYIYSSCMNEVEEPMAAGQQSDSLLQISKLDWVSVQHMEYKMTSCSCQKWMPASTVNSTDIFICKFTVNSSHISSRRRVISSIYRFSL